MTVATTDSSTLTIPVSEMATEDATKKQMLLADTNAEEQHRPKEDTEYEINSESVVAHHDNSVAQHGNSVAHHALVDLGYFDKDTMTQTVSKTAEENDTLTVGMTTVKDDTVVDEKSMERNNSGTSQSSIDSGIGETPFSV